MQQKYRLYRRKNGTFYWQDNHCAKQGSLKTKDKIEARRLLNAMNEAHQQPVLNLALGRAYLAAHDPRMIVRTWQDVMDEMASHGGTTTQIRCARAMRSPAYDPIRRKPLVETTGEDLLRVLHANGNSVAHYLRRFHNLALDLGWLAWPVLAKRAWPQIRTRSVRAITDDEHARIIASEHNPERRAYYALLYETGAAQFDGASLTAENIDWNSGILVYTRQKKRGKRAEPCRLTIGSKLREILLFLPQTGDLFPSIKCSGSNARATEFRRRCRIAGVSGVSLHSYRHAWAQRAKACGYPQRFAQEALGHSSRAVHEAYAAGALVVCPALEEYQAPDSKKLVALPLRANWSAPAAIHAS